jgi:hypothetical protein
MTSENTPQVLRLQKWHEPDPEAPPDIQIGRRLEDAQSVPRALLGGVVAIVLFCAMWAMLSVAIDRFFPWLTLVLGLVLGLAVRRAGLGLDWRFPLLAAALAAIGSVVGNIVVAAAVAGAETGISTLAVLQEFSALSWAAVFDEVMTPADAVFAMFTSAIAAFYSIRRLSRRQYLALRLWRQSQSA